MPWYFYLALRQLFPTGRFPFFTLISVVGVSLGVAVLVIVTSVMGGFGYEIRRMIVDTEGEVTIKSTSLIEDAPATLAAVRKVPGVAAATPTIKSVVYLNHDGVPAFPQFRGIDLDSVNSVTHLGRFVTPAGALENLDDDSVILSSGLAAYIGANVGDEVVIYSPLLLEKLEKDPTDKLLPRSFRVTGLLYLGHKQLDSSTVYGTLRAAQDLYGLGSRVHWINVRLQPTKDEGAVLARLNAALPRGLHAYHWTQNWADFLWILNLEKTVNFFLLLIIVIIAAFSVMSSLLISVVRKTREIGLLGALGASPRQVAFCFCVQAFLIGLAGTIVGLALGFGVLAIRNDLILGLADLLKRRGTLEQFYEFSEVPSNPMLSDILTTVVLAIVISTLAGLLPAWRAAKLKPVEALRSE